MPSFLDLLYDEAPLADFDRHLAEAERDLDPVAAAALRADHDVAVRLRDLMTRIVEPLRTAVANIEREIAELGAVREQTPGTVSAG